MPNKALEKYISEQIRKGYSATVIKNNLLKYGYQAQDVERAIKHLYSPEVKHVIHFSPTALIGIAAIVIGIVLVSILYFTIASSPPDQLLDLNLEPVSTTVEAGQTAVFITEVSNLGSSARYDVVLRYEVIGSASSQLLTFKEETRAIETIGSKQTQIPIPADAEPGRYILRAIATYSEQRAVATTPITIRGSVGTTQPEPIEEEPVVEQPDPIEPDPVPEIPEEQTERQQAGTTALTTFETLEQVEEIAPEDSDQAVSLCNDLSLQTSRDLCFNKIAEVVGNKFFCDEIIDDRTADVCLSNVAKNTDDSSICEDVSKDSRKDSCYMNFVIDKKDYTVCVKVTNQYLRQSCQSLSQLAKLNVTDTSYYESLINQSLFEFV